jgi:hypothetical protein
LLDVVPRRGRQFLKYGRVDRCSISDHLDGAIFNVDSALRKNRRAVAASRRSATSTSMT